MQGLDIAAMRCKIVKYENIKPTTQCNKCQKYNYSIIACRNQISNCRIYAQKHATHKYRCLNCNSNKACAHMLIKCINCNDNHQTDDKKCVKYTALINAKRLMQLVSVSL